MTTIKPEALESDQAYYRESRYNQEIFSCKSCGERMTELEYCKHNGECYGCLDLSRQEDKP